MKYKLINNQTGEEHICYMVVIDGWDYYVSNENIHVGDYYLTFTNKIVMGDVRKCEDSSYNFTHCKKVIATNNPNIDVPKVVDEFTILNKWIKSKEKLTYQHWDKPSFLEGYNKSQETHSNSDDDMIEFAIFYEKNQGKSLEYWGKDLFKIWKEQRPKTLYYE